MGLIILPFSWNGMSIAGEVERGEEEEHDEGIEAEGGEE